MPAPSKLVQIVVSTLEEIRAAAPEADRATQAAMLAAWATLAAATKVSASVGELAQATQAVAEELGDLGPIEVGVEVAEALRALGADVRGLR